MRVLVDTNVLGRLSQPAHAQHPLVSACLRKMRAEQHELRIVPQVVFEYWAIASRTIAENGLGFTTEVAFAQISRIKTFFPVLRDDRGILEHWERLVVDYQVSGKATHDARLVAAMMRHELTHVLTLNVADFARYREVTVLTPEGVVSA